MLLLSRTVETPTSVWFRVVTAQWYGVRPWVLCLHIPIVTEKCGRRSRREAGTCEVCLIAMSSPLKRGT